MSHIIHTPSAVRETAPAPGSTTPDPRPTPPTFEALDVTGWPLEEVLDLQQADDDAQDRYTEDLAAWEARQTGREVAEDVAAGDLAGIVEDTPWPDAEVMVRRSERALGQAIRTGQERGEIETEREARVRAVMVRDHKVDNFVIKPRALDYIPEGMTSNGAGIGHLTDDVTDAEFESAIERARDEGNVSRANVVRKVREVQSGAEVQRVRP